MSSEIEYKALMERLWEMDRMALAEAEAVPVHSWARNYYEAKSIGIRQAIRAAQEIFERKPCSGGLQGGRP